MCPQQKYIHHHLVGVFGQTTSRETPGEVNMDTVPAYPPPRGSPGREAGRPHDQVVVGVFPLCNVFPKPTRLLALRKHWPFHGTTAKL